MRLLFITILLLSICTELSAQVKAKTDDGRSVILYENGTWRLEGSILDSIPLASYVKPANALQSVKGGDVLYRHYYDDRKWILGNTTATDPKEYAFTLKNAFVEAQIVPENVKIDINTLKVAAFQNAQAVAKDMRILYDEMCLVNGVPANKIIMRGTVMQEDVTYYCLYYAGARGVVQVVANCATANFEKYKKDMEEFLYGFTLIID